ncbi:MAG: hypothetical protein ACK5MQ_16940 [Pikeienuella sp.]
MLEPARHAPDQFRALLRRFLERVAAEIGNDPEPGNRMSLVLNLGQWRLANGNLIQLIVTPSGAPPSRLRLAVNIREFFRAGLSRLIPNCYDQQAIFPEKMIYTQIQAARIFHGLYEDFHPPVVDGEPVTDMDALQNLDWSRLADAYRSDAATRRGFCANLR